MSGNRWFTRQWLRTQDDSVARRESDLAQDKAFLAEVREMLDVEAANRKLRERVDELETRLANAEVALAISVERVYG